MRFYFALLISITIMSFSFSTFAFTAKDSIGLERRGNNLFIKHKVKAGEDVHSIARKYGVSQETIVTLNPAARKPLKVNQILYIPHPQTAYAVASLKGYKVGANETLYSIATKFDTDIQTLKRLNELPNSQIRAGQELLIPYRSYHKELYELPAMSFTAAQTRGKSTFQYHTVGENETLYSLSKKYSVNIDSLKKWNQLNGSLIDKGQKLIVGKQAKPQVNDVIIVASANPKSKTGKTMKESGVCEVFKSTSTRLACLHKTALNGTIIKIYNESNGRFVEAEVVGKLQDLESNKNVIIRITQNVAARLGTTSKAFPVYIVWVK